MQLDYISKHCIIIGAFGFSVCLTIIAIGLQKLYLAYKGFHGNQTPYAKSIALMILANAVGALVSILAINGIKEGNPIIMAPGLLAVFGVAVYFLYQSAMEIRSLSFPRFFDYLFYPTIVLGLSTIVLFPLVSVFLNMNSK